MKKFVIVFLLAALVIGGYFAYPYAELYFLGRQSALNIDKDEERFLYIPTGSDMNAVAEILVSEGLIDDAVNFKKLAQAKNYSGHNVVPGKYLLKGDMNNNDLINHLRAGNGALTVNVTFNNCRDLRDLAGKVGALIEADSTNLINYILHDTVLAHYGFNTKTIGALFLPDTYEFYWNTDAETFMRRMADEYKKFWNEERKAKAAALNLTQSEVTTLASVVVAEQGKHKSEWPIIAGLYINRLKINMKLQSDPTAIFALHRNDIRRVTNEHLSYDSPYNTYLYNGLPPGPINIPPAKAIDAVLNHVKHNYYYMCAKPEYSGLHYFENSYEAHLRNASKYHTWLKQEGIR